MAANKTSQISLRCPECNQILEANPELSDKVANCPKCEHRFEIPAQPKQCAKGEVMMDANHIRGPEVEPPTEPLFAGLLLLVSGIVPFIFTTEFPSNISPIGATVLIVCSVAGILSFVQKRPLAVFVGICALVITGLWAVVNLDHEIKLQHPAIMCGWRFYFWEVENPS